LGKKGKKRDKKRKKKGVGETKKVLYVSKAEFYAV